MKASRKKEQKIGEGGGGGAARHRHFAQRFFVHERETIEHFDWSQTMT